MQQQQIKKGKPKEKDEPIYTTPSGKRQLPW
jgi:hypothetical protein